MSPLKLADDSFNPYVSSTDATDEAATLDSSFLSSLVGSLVGPQGPPGRAAVDATGGLKVTRMLDDEARAGTLYYSMDQQTLVYKDDGGQLFRLSLAAVTS